MNRATNLSTQVADGATPVERIYSPGTIVRGHAEIQRLLDEVAARKPPVRRFHRTGYLTDGKRLIWEYPREVPDGDQMDFVEVMELNDDGFIQRHRVYWGWFGVRIMQRDQYHA
jgi:hypothetical protein